MKTLPLVVAAVLPALPVSAAEQCVTLGDSLTFAYEAEFGFEITFFFVDEYGDGFGSDVRNWIEILNAPIFRNDRFDIGARNEFDLSFPVTSGGNDLLFRHDYNWALPGLRIEELRAFIVGETTFEDMIDKVDPLLPLLLEFSDLDTSTAFELSDLETQVQTTAERLVFFIGGNDVRSVYGDIYHGLGAGSFVADFINDAIEILDRVLTLNPNIQIVVVNVPHIGITPDIKNSVGIDPVGTERVTAVLHDLNDQLAGVARDRGLGCADIFTPTLSLLETAPLCIHGVTFVNEGSTTGDLDYVWLNGEYSANFHPNTNAQTVIANAVIDAFNRRYQTGIAPLSATEILSGLHGKSTLEIDMPFATWMAGFGLTGLPVSDDSDGDGTRAGVEFALGLNPTLHDSDKIATSLVDDGGPALELSYPIRLPASVRYSLTPAYSVDLTTPFAPFAIPPATGADGLARAWIPVTGGTGFLRLESTIRP